MSDNRWKIRKINYAGKWAVYAPGAHHTIFFADSFADALRWLPAYQRQWSRGKR